MSNDQTRKVREIFEACLLESSAEQRDQLLKGYCLGDGELESDVRKLLEAQALGGSFLEHPLVALLDNSVDHEGPDRADTPTKTHDVDEDVDFSVAGDPRTIGPYKLREQIGEGGFGLVYVAEQEKPIRRKVAIKLIKPGMDTRQIIARFEAERQALAMLDHPNIAKILDGGTTDQGRPYFAMELVPGVPITQFCDQVNMSIRERIGLFFSVCSAVQHAHQKGIIHRDIKPSNVLVTMRDDQPVVKVIDFGVAKALNQRLTENSIYSAMGQMIGTPIYMSPEQAQMNLTDVDTRSDIYSLGVLLYELLTGTTPFDLETLKRVGVDQLRKMICETEPPRPSSRISTLADQAVKTISDRRQVDFRRLRDDLHGELDWIVMKTLEKNRSRRYETVSGLAADLQRYLNDEPVQACPPSIIYRLQKFGRKHKGILATVALVMLTMLIGIVLTSRQAFIASREANRANKAEQQAKQSQAQAEAAATASSNLAKLAEKRAREAQLAAEQEARQRAIAEQAKERESEQRSRAEQALYIADIRLAADRIDDVLHSEAINLLIRHLPEPDQSDRRSWEWFHLVGNANQSRHEWQAHEANGVEIDWSPDGNRIATVGYDTTFKIWDANTGKEVKSFNLGETINCGVAWSPDGKEVAWTSASDEAVVRIWDSVSDTVETLDADTASIWNVMWNKSGDRLLVSGMLEEKDPQSNLVIWERDEDAWKIRTKTMVPHNVNSARWDPKEERISVCPKNSLFEILDGESLEVITTFPEIGSPYSSDWNPASDLLAVGTQNGQCVILDPESGEEVCRFPAHTSFVYHVEWSSRGDRLATCGGDGLVKIWNSADWTLLQTLSGHSGHAMQLTWKPDDTEVASIGTDGQVFVWETARESKPSGMFTLTSLSDLFAWTDDNLIRSVTDRMSITDRDPRSGQIRRSISLPSPDNWALLDCNLVSDRDCNNMANLGEVFVISQDRELIPQQVKLNRTSLTHATMSPDGNAWTLVNAPYRTRPTIFSVDGTHERLLGDQLFNWVWQSRWSPNGQWIALVGGGIVGDDGFVANSGWVHLIDPETGKVVQRTLIGSSRLNATAVTWSPDSQWIVAANMEGFCQMLKGETLSTTRITKLHAGRVYSLDWHPQADRVASSGEDRLVKIWEGTSGEVLLSFPMEHVVNHVEWSPDGSMLAACDVTGNIHVWDTASGRAMSEAARFITRKQNQRGLELTAIRTNAALLYERGQYQDAVTEFRRAIELSPNSVTDLLWLATALLKVDEPEQAYQLFLRSIEIAPNNANAQNNLGVFLVNQGRQEEAIEFLQRAIAIDSSASHFHRNLGKVYAQMRRYGDAVDALRRAQQLDPKKLDNFSTLALVQLLSEDVDGYRTTCQAMFDAFAETTDEEEARGTVWTCSLMDGAFEDDAALIELARGMAEKHPESHTHQTTYGAVLLRAGKLVEAASVLEQALNCASDGLLSPAYTRYLLSVAQWKRENRDAARRYLDEANQLAATELDASPVWNRKETLNLLRRQAETMIVDGEN